MTRRLDVLAVGELNPDLILSGIDAEAPVLGTEQTFTGELLTLGSSTAIACVLMQRLGLRTGFCGLVGEDDYGRFCRDALAREGVDCAGVRVHPEAATGVTISISYPADRMLLTRLGTMELFGENDIDLGLLPEVHHVHCGSFFLQHGLRPGLARLFSRARAAGCTTSLDLGWDPSEAWDTAALADVLPETDVIFPNMVELTSITRTSELADALAALHALGAREVAVKRGAKGGVASLAGQDPVAHPGFAVTPVDTTGAGDAFNAGYIRARLDGASPLERLRLANACGAATAAALGGTGGLRSLADAQEFLDSEPPKGA